MRILPISLFSQQKVGFEKNQYDFSLNKQLVQSPAYDTVNFTGNSIMNAKDFKRLCRFMVDLYTGEPMLSSTQLTKMKKRGFFRGPISEVVRKLQPYKDKYLEPTELEVFEMIEKSAEKTPALTLPQLFNIWYKSARSQFRGTQQPYFNQIYTLGAKLPEGHQQKFFQFMETVERKLYDEPIAQKFSQKEFSYKILKLTEKMSDINLKNRIEKLLSLLEDESFSDPQKTLSSQLIKQVYDFKNLEVPIKKSTYYERYFKRFETDKDTVRKEIIKKMLESADLKGYKTLARLCQNSIDMIDGVPVIVPFNNKAFAYDLEKLLEDMPDVQLKQDMLTVARNLPTSSKNTSALILKFKDSDANDIGDRLFNPAVASIEHIKPKSEGGLNKITNYALAKKRLNSERLSMPLWQYLLNFPVKNQYKYADKLIRLNNHKKIKYEDALGQLESLEREGRLNLTPYKQRLKVYEDPLIEKLKKKYNINK